MNKQERKRLIDFLDNLKELVDDGEIEAITIGYKMDEHTGTALLGGELDLFGLAGVINASVLKRDFEQNKH